MKIVERPPSRASDKPPKTLFPPTQLDQVGGERRNPFIGRPLSVRDMDERVAEAFARRRDDL